jgi:nitroreductase
MEKIANEIHPLIRERRSTRSFLDKQVDDETLGLLFEAARWSASSMNAQPWRFVVSLAQDAKYRSLMEESLNEANRSWASSAPVLIAVIAEMQHGESGRPNHHAWYDCGQAVANLILQAQSADLHARQMGGFNKQVLKENISIPDGFEPVVVIALGYKGSPESLENPAYQAAETSERKRKKTEEIVFTGKWPA